MKAKGIAVIAGPLAAIAIVVMGDWSPVEAHDDSQKNWVDMSADVFASRGVSQLDLDVDDADIRLVATEDNEIRVHVRMWSREDDREY